MSRVVADLVMRSVLCFGIATAVASLVHDGLVSRRVTPEAVFGAYDARGDLVPTGVVPLVPGQEFGWRVQLPDDGVHAWREVLVTPAAPREWVGADLVISNCGRTGVTQRTERAEGGVLEHAWTVTQGDPAGLHEIQLFVDDTHVKTFRFEMR